MKRRSFLRSAALTAGGIWVVPNMIIRPLYAGTVMVTVGASSDMKVQLKNGCFARQFNVGTWTKLRIGMRISAWSPAVTILTPGLFFGLCSGSTNQVMDTTTTNYLGFRISTLANWTYSSTYFSAVSTTCHVSKRVGTTWTNGPMMTNFQYMMFDDYGSSPDSVNVMFVDYEKGSPNWSVSTLNRDNPNNNISRALFLQEIVKTTPVITAHSIQSGAIAFDESAGTLDHINVGWTAPDYQANVTDIAVVKMAA